MKLGLILFLAFFSGCIVVESNANNGASVLEAEKINFVTTDADGRVSIVSDGIYRQGQIVELSFVNIGRFAKGSDGKRLVEMDYELLDSEGKQVYDEKNVLGEIGNVESVNDIASELVARINTGDPNKEDEIDETLPEGEYIFKATIYDKISGRKLETKKAFKLVQGFTLN